MAVRQQPPLHVSKKCLKCANSCKLESLGELYYCKKFDAIEVPKKIKKK